MIFHVISSVNSLNDDMPFSGLDPCPGKVLEDLLIPHQLSIYMITQDINDPGYKTVARRGPEGARSPLKFQDSTHCPPEKIGTFELFCI